MFTGDVKQRLRCDINAGRFGAYTTYSTFATESVNLLRQVNVADGLLYIVLTVVMCLLGAFVEFILAEGLLTG